MKYDVEVDLGVAVIMKTGKGVHNCILKGGAIHSHTEWRSHKLTLG
jgi:hypothetical protein